ncbi:hypothetical protein B5T_01126 [Alloalcanivorax dieselolei B5]|uniref:Uncharacterized protein n=1 Tax=Alcanivorax dieselolei (strain DSM 16502 / CGMCC 1.3690 / MCCC 1A00001 / B-5) TaxID=930169 RepID=K0C7G4_ALCDB|nr:hypothetical protein [Alloalcanivorax dieselolei]AFT69409.1 hypothetical protein B5T_01126 [Alloalcanivorax dieselolei B5]GGJ92441.1 hypothetical protein GCM10007426_21910 [Alloalcanivorax dieselolei]
MHLEKISHRVTRDAVHQATREVRQGLLDPALNQWFSDQGLDLGRTLFASLCPFDQRTYTGTLVDPQGHVLEFLVDLDEPDNSSLEDVSHELGPKHPEHPDADPCDRITMALLMQQQGDVGNS